MVPSQDSPPTHARPRPGVPPGLQLVAGWSWRILVVLALVAAIVAAIARLEVLFVALFVALLVTALLQPAAQRLRRAGVPRVLATLGVLIAAVLVLVGIIFLAVRSVISQTDELVATVADGFDKVQVWVESTLGMNLDQLQGVAGRFITGLGGGEGGSFAASAFGAASTAVDVGAGAGIALFATIFFVHDGPGIWAWAASLFPAGARTHVERAGELSWQTLSAYARGTVLIAAIDALGIGLGVALIGVPLAGPIAVIVFFASFIPIVGALVSGLVAVLVALATEGLTAALLAAAVVLAVQQLEGHLLQPLIQGKLVAIHPLAVVLAVAGGSIVAGLVGAVIAVPIVAVANVLVRYAARVSREEPADVTETGGVPGSAPAG